MTGGNEMKISTKGRYAVRMMLDLALHQADGVISLKEIAERQEISVKYLEQVVSILTKHGFIQSTRGKEGGYRLLRRPDEYVVGEILRAAEGSLAPIACLDGEVNDCPRRDTCITLGFWQGLQKVIDQYVDGVTLQDLLDEYNERNGNTYFI